MKWRPMARKKKHEPASLREQSEVGSSAPGRGEDDGRARWQAPLREKPSTCVMADTHHESHTCARVTESNRSIHNARPSRIRGPGSKLCGALDRAFTTNTTDTSPPPFTLEPRAPRPRTDDATRKVSWLRSPHRHEPDSPARRPPRLMRRASQRRARLEPAADAWLVSRVTRQAAPGAPTRSNRELLGGGDLV